MLDRKGFARIKNAPHRLFGHVENISLHSVYDTTKCHISRVFSRVLGSIGPNEVMVLRC
jgi:hypothetical protein